VKYIWNGTAMSDKTTLSELLKDLLTQRGLTAEKLAVATNIPLRFVNSLLEGEYRGLPSKPYIRGYLMKMAVALEIEPEVLLESYSAATELPSSGKKDNLPVNRFALKPLKKNRGLVFAIVIIVILLGIFIFRFSDIIGTPQIEVNIPATIDTNLLRVTGKIKASDRLTVNGEVVYPADDGSFEKDVLLDRGPNTIKLDVKRFLGRETKLTKQVIYQPTNQ